MILYDAYVGDHEMQVMANYHDAYEWMQMNELG
jgi:hypothetical protein